MTRSIARFAACLLGTLCACSLLEPRKDPTRFFVLAASPNAATAPTESAAAVSGEEVVVSIGPVHLPDYLLRPDIVRRTGQNQLEPSGADRWAEPIDRAFARVLCLDVAARLPECTVVAYPVVPAVKPAMQIEVDVSAFEGDAKGKVRLEGRFSLRDLRAGSRAVHAYILEHAAAHGETPELVATMSALLGELADQVAREVGSGQSR
jgi:uncharacterized lipoprotein YmbA